MNHDDFWAGRRPRARIPRAVIYKTADPARWLVLNRYPSGIIGAAVRVGHHRLLSVVWARP